MTTKLFTLALFLPGVAQPIRLNFQDETRAKTAWLQSKNFEGKLLVNDDFGLQVELDVRPMARLLCDVEAETNAGVEMAIVNARAQQRAQKRAQSDPELRSGIIGAGGGVLQFPGGNGGRPLG